MARIRSASQGTFALLKEVVGLQRKGNRVLVSIRKGHSFAITSLRQDKHLALIKDAVEKEWEAGLTVAIDEDTGASASAVSIVPTPAPDRDWAEKKATGSRAVQNIVSQLDGKIVGVE
jgi:translation elongation factor EF-1alpha